MISRRRDSRQWDKSRVKANRYIIHALLTLLALPGVVATLRAQETTTGETTSPPKRLSVAVL